MKRIALYFGIATALVASCSIQEEIFEAPQKDEVMFYASFEQPSDGTKVYANEDLCLRWTADDRISIFEKNTLNQQFRFTGETGDNAGGFKLVEGDDSYYSINAIPSVVSVYPYLQSTKITESEVLTVNLPAEQTYAKNTFGLGANTMVAVTSDKFLQFKNVGGYLRIRLYGEGVSVSSISLKGNKGEKIAGKATISMSKNGTPTVSMASDATDEITLTCESPVALGSTENESVDFWFVVPPVTFSKGFTISVRQSSGGVFEKSTSKSVTIERSNLSKMSPMEVKKSLPSDIIIFADEKVKQKLVAAFDTNGDGELSYEEAAAVTSGDDLKAAFGAIKTYKSFDEFQFFTGVTIIPDSMFLDWNLLNSIILPESLIQINDNAFSGCVKLSRLVIPQSVSLIGASAFRNCAALSPSITIPNNVKRIYAYTFYGCSSLVSINLPEDLTSIGRYAFMGCKNLEGEMILPESMTVVPSSVFHNCEKLKKIIIPDIVVSIESHAFSGCSSLESIDIPPGVTSIGASAFENCSSLTHVTIPEGISLISAYLFSGCVNLTDINIPESVSVIETYAFGACGIQSIIIPESVTTIQGYAFRFCTKMVSLSIPESVTVIEDYTFQGCISLLDLTLPESITKIRERAFEDCYSLKSITILSSTPPSGTYTMFRNTNDCPIYVPIESVENYKSARCWSDYADRIQAIPTSASVPVPEAVDLGLPSGIKWASFNLGASKPEEYGDYFTWGETEPKKYYYWNTYKFSSSADGPFSKYNYGSAFGPIDNKMVLDPEDDAATVLLGNKWRMPTVNEFAELCDAENCIWTPMTRNGINGYLVTSKIDGSNGNSIFIPAAGNRVKDQLKNQGSEAAYWSSSLSSNDPYAAYVMVFVSYGSLPRFNGLTIRPVYAE